MNNIVEVWDKLKETDNDKIKLYEEMDIFYEDSVYIIFKTNYSKNIAPIVCPYRKFHNLNFSELEKVPWKETSHYFIISVWRNSSNTDNFRINDLMLNNMKGSIMDIEQYLMATPIRYKKLPEKIRKKITKELI